MLTILLGFCLLIQIYSQISYIPSRMFTSYQLTVTNYFNLSNPLQGSNVSNPHTVSFRDVHDNINHHAIVLGGLSNTGVNDCQFSVTVAGATSTQYHIALFLYGNTRLTRMEFFLLLIGNQAANYIEAASINQTCNIASNDSASVGYAITNGAKTYITTIPSPFIYQYLITYYKISQQQSGTVLFAGLNANGVNASNPQQLQYSYFVDRGNRLTQIGLVIIIYQQNVTMTNVTTITFNYDTYENNLNYSDTSAPTADGFKTGFNQKCLLGHYQISLFTNDYFQFDISVPLPTFSYNFSNVNKRFYIFCMIQQYDCRQIDINCLQCISHSMCSVCHPEYYPQEYPNTTANCLLCNTAITGCLTCTNTSFCLTCVTPNYLQNGTNCLLCAIFITNCLNCTDSATCNGCVDYFGLVNSTTCSLCTTIMTGCQLCTSPTLCTKCLNGYYLLGVTCVKCNTGIDNCAVCINSSICTLCYSDSYLSSDNLTCICNLGSSKVSGLCAPFGCSSAYRFNSTTRCIACNASSSFQFNGTACNCLLGYQLSNQNCNLLCGDGRKITQACDDGNIINGDGCSSLCTVQADYSCSGGTLYNPSVCVYISQLTLSLVQILRTIDSNTAEITLSISPNIRPLTSMDFNKYMTLSVGNKISSYSTTYTEDGTITILADYSQHIEGQPATLTLAYDPTLVGLTPAVLTFNMVGHNEPLNVSGDASLQNMIMYLSYAVAAIFLLQLIISMFVHKMIGLQTMQIAQMVFFVRYLLGNNGSMAVYNMYPISYINGYNVFLQYTNVLNLDSVTMRMGLSKNFIFNVMVQLALIIILWIFSFYYGRKVADLKRRGAENSQTGMQELKGVMKLEYKFSTAAFIITVYSFFLFTFALLTSVQQNNEVNYSLPRVLLLLTMFVFFYVAMYITSQIYLHWKSKYDEDEGLEYKYVSMFLLYQMVIAIMIIGLYTISYALEIVAGAQSLYLFYLIVARPYFLKPQNILLIVGNIIGLLFTAILVVTQYIVISDQNMSYAILGFEGILVVVGILAFMRMYQHSRNNDKAFKALHAQEDKLKGKDTFSKNQFNKHKENLQLEEKRKPNLTEKKALKKKKEMQDLAAVKARLRGQYKYKVNNEE